MDKMIVEPIEKYGLTISSGKNKPLFQKLVWWAPEERENHHQHGGHGRNGGGLPR